MKGKISRRDWLKRAAAAPLVASGTERPLPRAAPAATTLTASGTVLPLTSTSEVYIPPRGRGFMKFSFDFPEPSVEFEGLRLSFRLYTFENTYGLDRDGMSVEKSNSSMEIRAANLIWAGGQEKAPGSLRARIRKNGSFIEWDAVAEMEQPIKSIAAIVRGVPRGKISAGGQAFRDHQDNEVLLGYPFGGGSLFTAEGMNSPVAVIQSGEKDFFFLSALNHQVRANRFYFQPGDQGYRAELTYEREGWQKSHSIHSPVWRAGRTSSVEDAFRPHYQHVERTFHLPDWEQRADVPGWFRDNALVVALHGMHWSGYIFNDYAKMIKILEWVATRIPAQRVLVFLAAWDGRYYWNYPLYQPDPRLGGADGFSALIGKARSMGFRMMPMFGTNSANRLLPTHAHYADASLAQIDGDAFNLNWVDWDNDRHNEGWSPYMNIGVDSWRQWLFDRISEVIDRFHVDAYFLDIVGGWENNTQADTHEGTRRMVADLRRKYPQVLACGEMSFDALLSCIPLFQVFSESGYPAAFNKYCRAFQHLSLPAPGRGSSGVHESGFGHFNSESLSLNDRQIPTLTVVDDTFDGHRDIMTAIISRAKERAGI
ncbi:MAG TPA: hypothetical protein VG028_17250 [Terriglobia bacterium]|nr:hypothetical protein [Terriglobia bacterium]